MSVTMSMLIGDDEIVLELFSNADGSVTLMGGSNSLFTFFDDGSTFAHGYINNGMLTGKSGRLKLAKE